MSCLRVRNLVKRFPDGTIAVDDLSLDVPQGALFTLLGPSGCGKTTTLRMIAGLEAPTRGHIMLDGDDFTTVPVHRRGIGMVFQSYALYPHMTVFENVAYGLRVRRLPQPEIRRRVSEALALVGLEAFAHRRPAELSGGQQQRVALARALVYQPRLLLLDEPLSNLDAKLRVHMREEIRRIQKSAGITTVYVTHDQEEALAISDQIAILNKGRLAQVGAPHDVYERPASAFVADFIGRANFLKCRVREYRGSRCLLELADGTPVEAAVSPPATAPSRVRVGDDAVLFFRPEKALLNPVHSVAARGPESDASAPGDPPECNWLAADVYRVLYLGETVRYFLRRCDGEELEVSVSRRVPGLSEGVNALVGIRPQDAQVFPVTDLRSVREGAA